MKEVVSLLTSLAIKKVTEDEIVIKGKRDRTFTFKLEEDNTLAVSENSFLIYLEQLRGTKPEHIANCILRLLRERHNVI